ncbi:hypothetical protein ONZ51_g8418 [Trametes cubensis]|uniref:DUF7330 domain-containing protein n=1 Tax=Trametes cubensis TaxID=1111947 RepID=A0AAD7X8K8_9APHY|nr:hypothetical protein ONZ51_g8418 [Trametes cubensis]
MIHPDIIGTEKTATIPPEGSSAQTYSEELPPPPPYWPQRSSNSISSSQVAQTVNHLELSSVHRTYLIDPTLPTPGITDELRKLHIQKKRTEAWGNASTCPDDIHASCRTHFASISLDLAVVGSESEGPILSGTLTVPTCIAVSSRHGRINLNLASDFEIHHNRSIDLSVESKHGRIVLFLPPFYEGPVTFQTRITSSVSFLPAFAARLRTLRATDRETVVVCRAPPDGAASSASTFEPHNVDGSRNRVLVRSRHGRIIVGISGVDKVDEAAIGGNVFQKLGNFFEMKGRRIEQYLEGRTSALETKLAEKNVALNRTLR